MIKRLKSVTEYLDFIHEINSDPDFSDPMLRRGEQMRNFLDAANKPLHQVWGIFEGEELLGLFDFFVEEEESYLEMIVGLSRTGKAYGEMLAYLKESYPGCLADFVYNPGNHLLHKLLREEGAEFETEYQKMVLKQEVPYQRVHPIELYSPKYREQYRSMHRKDTYWTADKVLDAPDRFRVLLAVENGEVAGYLDMTHKYEENEPYDIFVKEEYRRKGYGKAMLAKAVELNRPKDLMVLVEVDNTAAIALYESLGFVKAAGENNMTAHLWL